jgi:hypothetical protein
MESGNMSAPPLKISLVHRFAAFGIFFLGFLGLDRFADYLNLFDGHRSLRRSIVAAFIYAVLVAILGPPLNRFFSRWTTPLARKIFGQIP